MILEELLRKGSVATFTFPSLVSLSLLLLVRPFGDPVAMTSSVVDDQQTTGSIESHLIRKGLFTFGKQQRAKDAAIDARDLLGDVKVSGELREADLRLLAFFCSKWNESVAYAHSVELKMIRKAAKAGRDTDAAIKAIAARLEPAHDPTHLVTTPLGALYELIDESSDSGEQQELIKRARLVMDAILGRLAEPPETDAELEKLSISQAVSFTTNEAIQHAYGRRATGRDVKSIQESITRLMTTLVTFHGYDAWTGERNKSIVSSEQLIHSWSRSEHSTASQPHVIRIAPWLTRSLAAGHHTTYNLETARKLKGCSYKLWLWLEGQKELRSKATGNQMIRPVLAPLWTTLGITTEREVDKRKQLVKACKTILEVDGRYRQLELVSPASKRDNWHLVAVRINATEAVSLPTRSVLEEPMLKAA